MPGASRLLVIILIRLFLRGNDARAVIVKPHDLKRGCIRSILGGFMLNTDLTDEY